MASMPSVFGMKPEAPKSMQRRITPGSSLAETTTIGTLGYWARKYMRPEKPRTPGMVKSRRMRSTSPPRSSSFARSSKEPASAISTSSNTPETASRKAPRNSGWSSAMTKRIDPPTRFISRSISELWAPEVAECENITQVQASVFTTFLRIGFLMLLAAQTRRLPPATDELQDDFAPMRPSPMLGNIDALPGSERERPRNHRDVQRHSGEHRLDVRRHVIRPFGTVNPRGVGRCKKVERPGEIAAHVGIGVFLDDQRSRRMPYE